MGTVTEVRQAITAARTALATLGASTTTNAGMLVLIDAATTAVIAVATAIYGPAQSGAAYGFSALQDMRSHLKSWGVSAEATCILRALDELEGFRDCFQGAQGQQRRPGSAGNDWSNVSRADGHLEQLNQLYYGR